MKDGKPIEGDPAGGLHTIAMRRNITFHGDPDYVAGKLLPAAFPGNEFAWEK